MGIEVERSDSQFGRFTSARWSDASDPLLRTAQIWYFEGTLFHAVERHYPDGRAAIIVQLDTPHAPADAVGGDRFPPVCATGLATKPFGVVAPGGYCRVLGMSLDPSTLHAALGMPLADLRDATLDLHDLVGSLAAAELAERCAAARNVEALVSEAVSWLRARVARARAMDDAVTYAIDRLNEVRGNLPIATLVDEIGIASPRLARRFAATIGTTPKKYARILRFHSVLEAIRTQPRMDLAAVAATCGYYDQAHMYADFAEFCDRTPAEFARALHYPGSISIAEDGDASDFSKTA